MLDIERIWNKSGYGMKNCKSSPTLGWKYYKSTRNQKAEPICTYTDKYLQ